MHNCTFYEFSLTLVEKDANSDNLTATLVKVDVYYFAVMPELTRWSNL
jgi:hypothetical protein